MATPTHSRNERYRPGRVAVLSILVTTLLLPAACSFKQAAPVKQTYLLEAKRTEASEAKPTGPALRVRGLRVSAPFDGKGFVYRIDDLRYETDFYHEFLVPPRVALTEQLRQWLAASKLFASPLQAESRRDGDLILEGNVNAFYGDFREKSSPKAILETQVTILPAMPDAAKGGGAFFQRNYRREVALKEASPSALAGGWNQALEQILAALEADLKQVRW